MGLSLLASLSVHGGLLWLLREPVRCACPRARRAPRGVFSGMAGAHVLSVLSYHGQTGSEKQLRVGTLGAHGTLFSLCPHGRMTSASSDERLGWLGTAGAQGC